LQIKGGVVEGNSIGPAQVDALSKSPSREELLGKIVAMCLAPGEILASALLGAGGTVCGQVKSIADKEPEPEEPGPEGAPAASPAAS
jgi:large subunit ribosomal protein L10